MIHGEKVILRALESADLEAVHRWANDADVTRWLGRRLPISLAEQQTWLESKSDARELRLAIDTQDGQFIGWCDLTRWQASEDSAVLTLCIGDKTRWGGGYGTDATLTLCAYGFAELNLHRIGLFVFAEHAPAIHIYEKCGFAPEGRLRQNSYRHGARQDLLIMGLLRDEFKQKWPERWEKMCG